MGCQEQLLMYSRKRKELLDAGVDLIMISIGKPDVGRELINHLGLEKGEEFLYTDINNVLYNELYLNSGFLTSLVNSPATAFSFRDRIFNGKMGVFMEVMGKWKDAIYIPPERDQPFNQGGVFILDHKKAKTVCSHYDESFGTHADVDFVTKIATDAVAFELI